MEYFGKTKNNEDVSKYWLITDSIKIGILNYGGVITDIIMPNIDGIEENLVLGFDNMSDYETKSPKFGCIIGRTAGRIAYGKFSINEKPYSLEVNNGFNHLHGGSNSLSKKVWKATQKDNSLELTYFYPSNENGYPGNVNFKVVYTLDKNELTIKNYAETDEDTIINMTNHSYFNLAGNCKEDCLNHSLFINSDMISTLHKDGFVTGDMLDVTNTPFDFRKEKLIGQDIYSDHSQILQGSGYDHPFMLKSDLPQIFVSHKESGRTLEIETDQKAVVFYSGNYLGTEGLLSCGEVTTKRLGFCLETQNIPNHINIKGFDQLITKESPYYSQTLYRFKLGGK